MKRVEFIGASYVGKSTLYNAFHNQTKSTDSFLTEEQFRDLARKKMGMGVFLYRKTLETIINKLGGENKVYKIPEVNRLDNQTLAFYKYSLSICFQREIINLKGIAFANETYFSLLRLIAKYNYYQALGSNKTLIAEESIIHWHLVLHELLSNNNLKLPSDCKKDIGLFPKAIIYCYTDEETLLERIKLREKSKKINQNHHGRNNRDILQSVVKKQNVFLQYTRTAESLGMNVLKLNTADDIEKNTQKIQLFLKKLQ